MNSRDDIAAGHPAAPAEEADRRRRRIVNLVLGASMAVGVLLTLTAPEVTPNGIATAVICGACGVLAVAAAARGR